MGMRRITRQKEFSDVGRLLSVPDLAARLGMKPKGAWGIVDRREIESVKVGRLRRVSEKALRDYLARNTTPAMRDCQ